MVFALIAMGLMALAGIADLATEALEEGADDIQERFDELRDDPRIVRLLDLDGDPNDTTPRDVLGVEGQDDLLQGAAGNDNIVGNFGDLDTLEGGPGDDRLTLTNGASATGGAGADIFQVYPDSNGLITDFRPGVDQLRIDANEDLVNQEGEPALDWRRVEDGFELHYASQGVVENTTDSFVALFQGLDVPPPVEDITLTIFGEQPGDETIYSGDEINFAQNLRGTDGDDQFDLTDVYSDYEVYVGEGDDDVTFNALRGRVYLEEGDDTYQSTARADAGTVPSETVLGGAGNDVILGGNGIVMSYGGLGDDTLGVARSDELDAAEVMLNGGAGADALTFSENATVTGGDGADAFTFLPMLGEAAAPSILTDFDPDEDALLIQLDPLYVGAGIATLAPNGDGTLLQIDGQTALMLTQPVSDLSSIVVLQ